MSAFAKQGRLGQCQLGGLRGLSSAQAGRAVAGERRRGISARRAAVSKDVDLNESMLGLETLLLASSVVAFSNPAFALADEADETVITDAITTSVSEAVTETITTTAAPEVVTPEAVTTAVDTAKEAAEAVPEVNPVLKYVILGLPLILYTFWTIFRTINRKAKFGDFVNLVVGFIVIGNLVSIVFFKVRWF